MPTKEELEKINDDQRKQILMYTAIIVIGLIAVGLLTVQVMDLQEQIETDSSKCFHEFSISWTCEKTGNNLTAKTNDTGKYWICGDSYEVKAC